jgi:predicted dehydrogenase
VGIALFVEKPLSHSLEHLVALKGEVETRGLTTLVGCNMRFHPGPRQVKALLEAQTIGRVLFARVHTGSYLPEWRPGTDYRKSYSANASMGGGCLLDCIHEIDLARWYLGKVRSVYCLAERVGSLEIDVEDLAVLVCRHESGTVSEVHLDYLQRSYERGCQVVGENGSVFWDFRTGEVRRYDAAKKEFETFAQPADWTINQMYVDEMEHFLHCLRDSRPTLQPIGSAIEAMQIVLAAKRSSRTERTEKTDEAA